MKTLSLAAAAVFATVATQTAQADSDIHNWKTGATMLTNVMVSEVSTSARDTANDKANMTNTVTVGAMTYKTAPQRYKH